MSFYIYWNRRVRNGFSPKSPRTWALFHKASTGFCCLYILGTYMHTLNSCLVRIKSSFSQILREKRELFDVWWEGMLIYIPLGTCWKLRWKTPKSTLGIRHTWREKVFLMWNHPWQHNDRAVCNCSVTSCSGCCFFFLYQICDLCSECFLVFANCCICL